MAQNPGGFQIVGDNGFPDTTTMRAITACSGGQIVSLGSQAATVGSMNSSFGGPVDIWAQVPASGIDFPIGVVLNNSPVASGGDVTILRKGNILLTACGNIAPGDRLMSDIAGGNGVVAMGSESNPVVLLQKQFGVAYTGASSGGYVLTRLDL